MMKLKAFALNEIGGRSNQEDCIFPPKGESADDALFFMVCDGMGGHEDGEMASRSVCDSFANFLRPYKPDAITSETLERALAYACDELDKQDATPDDAKKPGTTLTFFCLNSQGALMAHIGDSRIYHLRRQPDGTAQILFRTEDHSLVNDLLRAKVITPEEAENHPEKNLVSRIIQAKAKRRSKLDITQTADVRPGDLFLLCSDGILEQVKDAKLCETVAANPDAKAIIDEIKSLCEGKSKDNFSAYLLEAYQEGEQEHMTSQQPTHSKWLPVAFFAILLALAGAAFFLLTKTPEAKKAQPNKDVKTEVRQETPDSLKNKNNNNEKTDKTE
ncbi:MAG: protein phosphatase 2C domain-containing protein [Dysgonamonadaceae bacterium]|jgi:protein phosphatase|nr:protein phosphatase 2C domain-containing protein [Dysgonamonadaceae bacterium]